MKPPIIVYEAGPCGYALQTTLEGLEIACDLMAYLGLTPTEHSSGSRVKRGSITKTGNSHVRRVLVEAAWHYRHRPRTGRLYLGRAQPPARRPGRVGQEPMGQGA